MLTNFEQTTKDLNQNELKAIDPVIVIISYHSKEAPISNSVIRKKLEDEYGIKISSVKLRKIISHIRLCSLFPIIGCERGYYGATHYKEIVSQIQSLHQRAKQINAAADGLSKYLLTLTQ